MYIEIFDFLGIYIAKSLKGLKYLQDEGLGSSLIMFRPFLRDLLYIPSYNTNISIYTLPIKNWFFLIMCQKNYYGRNWQYFLGHLFLIMFLTNIQNIGDIYYPRNWDNFHNKTNYILVENEPTKLIFILSF